jgi:serine/tyrosine/threonine adenylyltransferase
MYNFDTTYTKLNSKLFQLVNVPNIENPKVILFNSTLSKRLNITYSAKEPEKLLGSTSLKQPFAQAYAGHQFGYFTNLGDGRAMILGEHLNSQKERYDVQLKGSGKTKYSRGGDGLATESSMIREYLYSYVMKNLYIASSESLAVISTNQEVYREKVHDSAILIRVMKSHIRFGTFEYASQVLSKDEFQEFIDYVIGRHYSNITHETKKKYLNFFQKVIEKTIDMVVDWYRVGFVHGVMNTDNMSIVGETFDYGPCSFMNQYDRLATFSAIDTIKRYSFGNQKIILKWNLSVLGETLIPFFDDNISIARRVYEAELLKFDKIFDEKFSNMMKSKLGIIDFNDSNKLINYFLEFLEKNNLDYTNTFLELMYPNSFNESIYQSIEFKELRLAIKKVGLNLEMMKNNNPQRILRNYLVEEAIDEFENNKSLGKIKKLLEAVSSPYSQDDSLGKYQLAPPQYFDKMYQTHCNT